jgi:competence protein ComEA
MRAFQNTRIITTNVAQDRLRSIIGERTRNVATEMPNPVLFEPPPSALAPIAKMLAGAVAVIAIFIWLNRPQNISPPTVVASGMPISSSATNQPTPTGKIVVDVEGNVVQPGLQTLPASSRVADAITAAGGLSGPDSAGSINLAQRITDGELIMVGATSATSKETKINLNTATATELDSLPGVGPVMAGRIVAWRDTHQQFHAIEELQEVPGIGPKVFENLKDLVRI